MDENEGMSYKLSENLSKRGRRSRFVWNPTTREFLGRNFKSWLKITIIFVVVASIATLLTVMLVAFRKPQPSNSNRTEPGLEFQPSPPSGSTLIWFKHGRSGDWKSWVDRMNEFLEPYRQFDESAMWCEIGQEDHGQLCYFSIQEVWEICTKERSYGYDVGRPCIIIKLDKVYGWKPEPYDVEHLPEEMPLNIKEMYDANYIYLTCEGKNAADKENIGPLEYYPSAGMPNYYFPFKNQKGYLPPLVFVHFEKPTQGVLINVECKAWAKNLDRDRTDGIGRVHFELLIN